MFNLQTTKMLRIVYLERLKKLYASFSIPQLLSEYGIDDHQLIPPVIDPSKYFSLKAMKSGNFTPLWYYDNTEFDIRNADQWIKKDIHTGVHLATFALVYLPIHSNDELSKNYKWMDANVISYNHETKTYSVVVFLNNFNRVYSTVHRIQIHFKGEDPREFVKRIKYAILRRNYCEKVMQ